MIHYNIPDDTLQYSQWYTTIFLHVLLLVEAEGNYNFPRSLIYSAQTYWRISESMRTSGLGTPQTHIPPSDRLHVDTTPRRPIIWPYPEQQREGPPQQQT